MSTTWTIIGAITNEQHNATPIVIGDWPSLQRAFDGERSYDVEDGDIEGVRFCQPDLELRAPTVLVRGEEILLVAEIHLNTPTLEVLDQTQLLAVADHPAGGVEGTRECDVPSGKLAMMLAYVGRAELEAAVSREVGAPSIAGVDSDQPSALFTMAVTPGVYEVVHYEPSACGLEVPVWAGRDDLSAFFRVVIRRRA